MSKKAFHAGAWVFAVVLATIFLSPLRHLHPPDFMPFYFGGKLAAAGQISHIYDRPAYQPLIAELRATGERMNPMDAHYFIRPAFQAFFYIPFTWFSYPTASWLAVLGNVVLLGVLVWKLPVWLDAPAGIRVCLFVFMPFLWSIGIGQDTLLLTLIVAYSLYLASQGREVLAGLVLGLAAYKPHLIWAVPLALIAARKWKMAGSFVATGLVLAGITLGAVGKGGISQWMDLVRAPSSDIWPDRMGNIRALTFHFGTAAAIIAIVFTVACFAVVLRRGGFKEKFSSAIWVALLFSPHTYWQDYSLAVIPALAASGPAMRLFLLLPWPYFYPAKDELPAVLMSLVWLGVTVGTLIARRLLPGYSGAGKGSAGGPRTQAACTAG